jgi:CubicO group peptidase (beta-lactamase class C family)
MRKLTLFIGVGLAAGVVLFTSLAAGPSRHAPARNKSWVAEAYGRLPLAFEPVRSGGFIARGGGATVLVSPREAVFERAKSALRMRFEGASPRARLHASRRLAGVVNEFVGNDPARWRRGVPTFGRLEAPGVYPGIDLAWHGRTGALEYDFLVAPGADPGRIKLRFSGQEALRLDSRGDLVLRLDGGELRQLRPRAFQTGRPVSVRFVPAADGGVRFALGRFDPTKPLLIDPTVPYSTYYGGSGDDIGRAIAVDSSGYAYVTGSEPDPHSPSLGLDAYVLRFNPSGTDFYGTIVGGHGDDVPAAIAVDSAGNAFVTGQTAATDFPVTSNHVQMARGGGYDAFVIALDVNANYVYGTYLGGSGTDNGAGIAVDSSENMYVTGSTNSTNFPTRNPFQVANGGGTDDAFVSKINAAGTALVYSSYLGGSDDDEAEGLAIDGAGSAYVVGGTGSTNFPTHNAFQAIKPSGAGGEEAFVSKVNASGTALVYSTYLGGTGIDWAEGVAVDSGGNAYVTGGTQSTNFPTHTPIQANNGGGGAHDVFLTKFNSGGSALVYSTYLGGSDDDEGKGLAVDSTGAAYITGWTGSPNFPTRTPVQSSKAGSTDAFATKVNAGGTALVFSTYLGGTGVDEGQGIAVDSAGSAYLSGDTNSTNFPTSQPTQSANAGGYDAFVTKIAPSAPTAVAVRSFTAVRSGSSVLLRWRIGSDLGLAGFEVRRNGHRLTGVLSPGTSSLRDRNAGWSPAYELVLVGLDGSRTTYGPVRPATTSLQQIADRLTAAGAPGALVVLRTHGGARRAASGLARLKPADRLRATDRYRIASVTKPFTAAVVMQLVAEGRLHVSDTVERWLPGKVPNGSRITLRELLGHTSGLFDFTEDAAWIRARNANPGRVWTPAELVAIASSHPPLFAPGTDWSYSSTNYVLLGLVVEAVTKAKLGDVLQRRIFGPLGLRDTSYPTATAIPGRVAHGYVGRASSPRIPRGALVDATALLSPSLWGAGQIVSNADDVTRFFAALMHGDLVPARLVAEMKQPILGHMYGLGLLIVDTPCGRAYGHDGDVPGYRNVVWATGDGSRVATVMVNVDATHIAAAQLRDAATEALCPAG